METILAILEKLEPLLLVVVPTVFGIYLSLRDKIKEKRSAIKVANTEKSKALYEVWEHEESQRIIRKIKDLCDFYKDKGYMDRVQYLQLENGTVATSKLCNMFVSCLAEDGRYGRLSHFISKLQRVPYSRLACWIDKIRDLDCQSFNNAICVPNSDEEECNIRAVLDTDTVKSSIVAPIYDPNEILLGVCVFYYANKEYNNQDINDEIVMINRFRSSIQSIFLEYYLARKHKKEELKLEGDLDD